MKSVTIAILLLFAAGMATAQLTVVSTSPANLATNVSASLTSVSITFSAAVDTTSFLLSNKGPNQGVLTSLDTISAEAWSVDRKTVTFTVHLTAGKPYFFCLFYAKSLPSTYLGSPYVFYFTTGASFPTTTVGGTVNSGSSGVSPAGSFVALSSTSLSAGDPKFVAGTIADGSGNFSLPYVPNGTFYALAARDVNADGNIDPSTGDAVGTAASPVTVNNANITGVSITFQSLLTYRFKDALDSLAVYSPGFTNPHTLRVIQASEIDSSGKAGYWEFDYTGTDIGHSFAFQVQTFGGRIRMMDPGTFNWVSGMRALTSNPTTAAVDSFLARAERQGGHAYRPVPMSWNGFDVQLYIGAIWNASFYDMITDTSKFYLGVSYWYGVQGQMPSGQRRFVGDYTSGAILVTTAVSPTVGSEIPARFSLAQNYPNPFNPATKIDFALPVTSPVRLSVYNMLGQEVAMLVNGTITAGNHTVSFDGSRLASGIYFYRLVAGSYVNTMRMILVK